MRSRQARSNDEGFTLIEMLVVFMIIAILSAIAVQVFYRQREKGFIAQVQAALANGRIAAEAWRSDEGEGDFEDASGHQMDEGDLFAEGLRAIDLIVIDVKVTADSEEYCIVTDHQLLDPGPPAHDWRIATQTNEEHPSMDDECSFSSG